MNDTQKEGYRSRNHYGRTYTLLKVENHQQKVEIARLKEAQAKMSSEIEKVVNKLYMIWIVAGIIGGLIGYSLKGGL